MEKSSNISTEEVFKYRTDTAEPWENTTRDR